jgi:hypothetical protein
MPDALPTTLRPPVNPARTGRRLLPVAAGAWLLLLAVSLVGPPSADAEALGDFRIRATIRVALLFYALAAALMLRLRRPEWAATGRGQLARWCWTLAWVAYLVHLAMAFHHYHHWSHADAVKHTRDVSGVGEGIYVSHLFTLLWTLDVAFWWLSPGSYAARPAWLDVALHSFMAFVIFNGTVVYESGMIRWAGLGMFTVLADVWWLKRRGDRVRPVSDLAVDTRHPGVGSP